MIVLHIKIIGTEKYSFTTYKFRMYSFQVTYDCIV